MRVAFACSASGSDGSAPYHNLTLSTGAPSGTTTRRQFQNSYDSGYAFSRVDLVMAYGAQAAAGASSTVLTNRTSNASSVIFYGVQIALVPRPSPPNRSISGAGFNGGFVSGFN